uniref:SHSP domain-containing protein n=1 Tax=Opuntia streptacantha TaxID=393608 RepID=A0A7C8Z604_OPUST
MEREIVRRRMNTISGHFIAGIVSEDIAASTTHLFPLNCSSNLGSPFTRLDNRVHFGRQASAAQGYFMRQAAIPSEQDNSTQQYRVCSGNCINEDKHVACTPPLFSRPGPVEPLFARPAPVEFHCFKDGMVEGAKKNDTLHSKECPKFARPGGATCERKQFISCGEQISSPQTHIKGMEWSPRINIIESKCSYVITVELPGVDVSDIRVEMDGNKIIVKGKRTMKWSKSTSFSNDSFATYHRMEISQGPYQVVWPIPAGANKDSVSAEFAEGMLQITVPKLEK